MALIEWRDESRDRLKTLIGIETFSTNTQAGRIIRVAIGLKPL